MSTAIGMRDESCGGTSGDLSSHWSKTAAVSGYKPTSTATAAGTRASVLGVLLSLQRKLL